MRRKCAFLLPLLLLMGSCTDQFSTVAVISGVSSEGETLEVHFIDVGQADAALLRCGGQAMLIDGGNVEDGELVASYLEGQGVDMLDYVLCTHAHEDHVGGLPWAMDACTVAQALAPETEYGSQAFSRFVQAAEGQELSITIPEAGDTYALGGTQITVIGPVEDYEETNNTSIVLRADYGQTSFLFTGDMERNAEADLLDAGADLGATVLKVGHHGSDTSTSYPFLREVMPQYAVVSVGEGNSYGHPSQNVLSRLYDAGATVYRTDRQGTVLAVSDGSQVTFTTQKEEAPAAGRWEADEISYIGNSNSHVFHLDTCSGLPAEQNRVYLNSREAAVAAGYTPCGRCNP